MNYKYRVVEFLYTKFIKKIFFLFDPESVHDFVSLVGKIIGHFYLGRLLTKVVFNFENPILNQTICGVSFRNPVGLSAGFDKNANLINILPSVGFGFLEIGSVTLDPYIGNPKPRLYRLKKSKGLVVYYGLKNEGVRKIAKRILATKNRNSTLGVSVAKTNSTKTNTLETGIIDYIECLKYLEENNVGAYYTINISCPNTFGGEPFTTEESLTALLNEVYKLKIKKPIFVKLPINLNLEDFDALLRVCIKYKVNGVVIGNLTKVRDSSLIKDDIPANIKGGISGKPTWDLSNNLIAYTYKNYSDKLKIIGVGGIFSAEDAYTKIRLGSSLIELITGMIFVGPALIGKINSDLTELLIKDGYRNVGEAVGKGIS